jgi:hypothetical protein
MDEGGTAHAAEPHRASDIPGEPTPIVGRDRRGLAIGLGGVTAVATPIAAWWLIGDLSEAGLPPEHRDYIFRAPKFAAWIVPTLGAIALGAASIALAALVTAARRRTIDGRWVGSVVVLMIAGGLLAGIGRLVTAGGSGANIGGGGAILFGLPLFGLLIIWASFGIRRILRSEPAA